MSGLARQIVQVEATVRENIELRVITGLPDAAIKEWREWILNYLQVMKEDIDMNKITIHLSLADVKRQSSSRFRKRPVFLLQPSH